MRRDIFQAIADPTRRAIIAMIALQAMTPNALADHFNMTQTRRFQTFENIDRMRTGTSGIPRKGNLLPARNRQNERN
jgi:DNA-binding transcriptional ArsR family regulator